MALYQMQDFFFSNMRMTMVSYANDYDRTVSIFYCPALKHRINVDSYWGLYSPTILLSHRWSILVLIPKIPSGLKMDNCHDTLLVTESTILYSKEEMRCLEESIITN